MSDFTFSQSSSAQISVPRVFIGGVGQGAGVSTVTLGLLVSLKRAGVAVASAKLGPSLIDSTHYRRITGRLAHTLDSWLLNKLQIVNCFARLAGGAEFVVVESECGLFDHHASDYNMSSDAEISRALRTPVILVVDATGIDEGIAPLVQGFVNYDKKIEIVGIIANRVKNKESNKRLKAAIESLSGPVYLGGIPIGDSAVMNEGPPEGASGNRTLLRRNRLLEVGNLVSQHIDLAALQELGKKAGIVEVPSSVLGGSSRICRVAVADDAAFHLTVQDNLDLIRRAGGDLVAFSPLADMKLPPRTRAIYFPSGYVHLYASDLNANTAMLQTISAFAAEGGIIYAEGGSIAYLCRKIMLTTGETFQMAGVIPAIASSIQDESDYFEPTYCELTATANSPIAKEGDVLRGLRDSRWSLRPDSQISSVFNLRDREVMLEAADEEEGIVPDGLSPRSNIIASTAQIHWSSNPPMASHFIREVGALEDKMTRKEV